MATFKAEVKTQRADGLYAVYIRVTHNRKNAYIRTDMYVHSGKVKEGEITDKMVEANCAIKIKEYLEKLNSKEIGDWSVKQVIDYITKEDEKILFYPYCDEFIAEMRAKGRERTADGYLDAINSFKKHFTDKNLTFQDIKKIDINKWIDKLRGTSRAKQKYPTNMKAVFEAGCNKYNDYENNIIGIPNKPFYKLDIPQADVPQKRAVETEAIKVLFATEPKTKRAELALDVARLIIHLVGINSVDLYYMERVEYIDGKLCYNRHKTESTRTDKAYIEVAVRPEIRPLLEKYKGKNGYLFDFKDRYRSEMDFNKNVNKGLKQLCEDAGLNKMTIYTFRHTWATIASRKCRASVEMIGFCLNHASAHKTSLLYIDRDFSPIDELNNQVLEAIFNLKEGNRVTGRGNKKNVSEERKEKVA